MFPLTSELSYIIGVYLGDGFHFYRPESRSYQFRLKTIDKDFADNVNKYIQHITDSRGGMIRQRKDTNRYGEKPQWVLIYCDKKFIEFLMMITIDRNEVPQIIKDADKYNKLWFVRGLMDSEGWISKSKQGYYRIGIAMKNKAIMEYLPVILSQINISVGDEQIKMYPDGSCLYTRSIKQPFLINLFTIKRKQKRFRDYTRNILMDKDIVHIT